MLCATVEGSLPIAGGVEAAKRAGTEAKLEVLLSPMRTPEAFAVEEIMTRAGHAPISLASRGWRHPCAPPAGHISAAGREYCDRLLGVRGKLRKVLSAAQGLCILSAT